MRVESLEVSQLVLLYNTKIVKDFGSKLDFTWVGPYRIAEVHKDRITSRPIGSYTLAKLDSVIAYKSIHESLLDTGQEQEQSSNQNNEDEEELGDEEINKAIRDSSPRVVITRPPDFDPREYQDFPEPRRSVRFAEGS
ncbi:hypothetical protein EG327_000437 [Venturia inaequalis]|uniref:Uncharacterized protein n=1 Tax=Venturia inaequalis TaxID=5025 RepID=A0A8H3YQ57_VENIN|nr:hypothetical protein EG327_000437 [Venturia inaequalis]